MNVPFQSLGGTTIQLSIILCFFSGMHCIAMSNECPLACTTETLQNCMQCDGQLDEVVANDRVISHTTQENGDHFVQNAVSNELNEC